MCVVFENKITTKDTVDMKTNVILRTMAVILFTALLSVDNIIGQVLQRPASEILSELVANQNTIPLSLYPPGYLDKLRSLGDGLYPPTQTSTVKKMGLSAGQ